MKLTQEQLAELIAKVFTNLDEKRKACKENGEAVSDGIFHRGDPCGSDRYP